MAEKEKFKKIPIKCPKCRAIALHWNGVTKMPLVAPCPYCGQRIAYYPETNTTTTCNKVPERKSSSGKRFD